MKQRSLGETNSAARIITKTLKEAGMKPQFLAVALQSLYEPVGVRIPLDGIKVENKLLDATAIAERLGVYSKNDMPHGHAISAIISKLAISENEKSVVPFQNKASGHSGTNIQYSESVLAKIINWLNQNNFPSEIEKGDKSYKVFYKKHQSA